MILISKYSLETLISFILTKLFFNKNSQIKLAFSFSSLTPELADMLRSALAYRCSAATTTKNYTLILTVAREYVVARPRKLNALIFQTVYITTGGGVEDTRLGAKVKHAKKSEAKDRLSEDRPF